MTGRVLVAGVGNVFFGDDGFGVEVVRRLRASEPLPPGATATEFGVRGLHLAQTLLDPFDLVVVVEVAPRGLVPGALHVFDPTEHHGSFEGHSLDIPLVLAAARAFGATLPRICIVGCEPADLGARVGFSEAVREALDPAVELARRLVSHELETSER